ncbi:bifunctional helix-turn-helix transcriptional regulator/GNAT family N-acetyltransferase [Streptomonospora litoralis]|uniref:TDP-fucosamine acetyltransferase n=1 Tax=Streptomonospora litoralis TaxID=2498135 RepID=A0A4V0ZJ63_9ACTN|nr:helix-turn-helix domain-containing GNAT family N-acetyltransferase [Streptomonospora litoralis]QBI52382.1 TDP-fucosamine acetyltransferase [Streptomonospora litoralis]
MSTPEPEAAGVPNEDVAAIRAFNRFFTRRVGVLKPGLFDSPWSLTEARIMYELRHRARAEALDLRRELDMDAGQLSRVLTRLQRNGLVSRSPSPEDGRRQVVELTDAGLRAAKTLDERAREQVVGLVSHLSTDDRRRLIDAMATVRRLFDAPGTPDAAPGAGDGGESRDGERARPAPPPSAAHPAGASLRAPRPGDLGWIVARHGELYAHEYGWDSSFEAWVARLVAEHGRFGDTAAQHLWIAEADGERAGCISCVREDERTARLRLFLVEPGARGRGVGSLLVRRCVEFARAADYRRMVLSTYSVLAAARRIYEGAGFRLAEEHVEHVFGRNLAAQVWEREL